MCRESLAVRVVWLLIALWHTSLHRTVAPRGMVTATMTTIPVVQGPVELVVRFSSNQLSDIMGDLETAVTTP